MVHVLQAVKRVARNLYLPAAGSRCLKNASLVEIAFTEIASDVTLALMTRGAKKTKKNASLCVIAFTDIAREFTSVLVTRCVKNAKVNKATAD